LIAVLLTLGLHAGAQWLSVPSPGIPRTPDGKPNLSAPAPRQADGHPDLSGIWRQPNGVKYTVNLAADGVEVPMQPWAAELYKHRQDTVSKEDPVGYCNVAGVPQMEAVPYPYKFLHVPGAVVGYSVGHWDTDTLVVDTAGFNDRTWLDTGGHPHSDALHARL
jgi:hypothetical protein